MNLGHFLSCAHGQFKKKPTCGRHVSIFHAWSSLVRERTKNRQIGEDFFSMVFAGSLGEKQQKNAELWKAFLPRGKEKTCQT